MKDIFIINKIEIEEKLKELKGALAIIEAFEGATDSTKYDFGKGSIKAFEFVLSRCSSAETIWDEAKKDLKKTVVLNGIVHSSVSMSYQDWVESINNHGNNENK